LISIDDNGGEDVRQHEEAKHYEKNKENWSEDSVRGRIMLDGTKTYLIAIEREPIGRRESGIVEISNQHLERSCCRMHKRSKEQEIKIITTHKA